MPGRKRTSEIDSNVLFRAKRNASSKKNKPSKQSETTTASTITPPVNTSEISSSVNPTLFNSISSSSTPPHLNSASSGSTFSNSTHSNSTPSLSLNTTSSDSEPLSPTHSNSVFSNSTSSNSEPSISTPSNSISSSSTPLGSESLNSTPSISNSIPLNSESLSSTPLNSTFSNSAHPNSILSSSISSIIFSAPRHQPSVTPLTINSTSSHPALFASNSNTSSQQVSSKKHGMSTDEKLSLLLSRTTKNSEELKSMQVELKKVVTQVELLNTTVQTLQKRTVSPLEEAKKYFDMYGDRIVKSMFKDAHNFDKTKAIEWIYKVVGNDIDSATISLLSPMLADKFSKTKSYFKQTRFSQKTAKYFKSLNPPVVELEELLEAINNVEVHSMHIAELFNADGILHLGPPSSIQIALFKPLVQEYLENLVAQRMVLNSRVEFEEPPSVTGLFSPSDDEWEKMRNH